MDNILIGMAGKTRRLRGRLDVLHLGQACVAGSYCSAHRPKMVTFGLTYRWKQRKAERLRGSDEEDRKGVYIRIGDHYYDQNIVSASAAYLIKNAVA